MGAEGGKLNIVLGARPPNGGEAAVTRNCSSFQEEEEDEEEEEEEVGGGPGYRADNSSVCSSTAPFGAEPLQTNLLSARLHSDHAPAGA